MVKNSNKQPNSEEEPKIPPPNPDYYHVVRKGETVKKVTKKSG